MLMEQKPIPQTGLECPKCGCVLNAVWKTEKQYGQIRRQRVCRNPNCQHKYVTYEKIRETG